MGVNETHSSEKLKKKRVRKRQERNINRRHLAKESATIVKQSLKFESSFTKEENEAVIDQLGYAPSNLKSVSATDPITMKPLVCLLYPLTVPAPERRRGNREVDMEPFPTIYWLCCPKLKARLSALEVDQWVSKLEKRLAESPEAQQQMIQAHNAYAARRWSMVEPAHKKILETKGWMSAVRDVGIAGIRKPRSIKCLHTMYAYYLGLKSEAQGVDREDVPFPVGDWIHELLQSG